MSLNFLLMSGKILSICSGFVVVTTLLTTNVKSQDLSKLDPNERMTVLWDNALENVRGNMGASKQEFDVFKRFDMNSIYTLRNEAIKNSIKENYDPTLLTATAKEVEKDITALYEKFLNTQKLYPSSVDEYKHSRTVGVGNPCDSMGCTNINFNQGTLNTWYGYYGENASTATTTIIDDITGGALGAVTEACDDPNVISYEAGCSRTLTHDYQLLITNGGYDRLVPTIPRVSPWSTGGHSVMLGDSTLIGSGAAILSKTFYVSSTTSDFTYQYAVFLANPPHPASEQPFFEVYVLDENGDTIPNCGSYNVVSGVSTTGFDTIPSYSECGESFPVYYKNWTLVNVPLKHYIGQCVTVEFEVADCEPGGHFGYAYIDCSCSPLSVISSSPNICGRADSLQLTAPPGSAVYAWTSSNGGILTDTAQQVIWVDSTGVYRVITTPVTGASCADTLYDTVGLAPGPPPTPAFHTSVACAGQAVQFTNTSSNIGSANFYWDFYNLGIYADTNVINPTWTYSSPGTYTVTLQELYNGCGKDTSIVVVVDSTVSGAFLASNSCVGNLVTMTNTSRGATTYFWNYGDTTGGTSDTATALTGSYTYTAVGTYTISMIAKNSGPCPDTVKQVITINKYPKPTITGLDSVCPSTNDTLRVTGGSAGITTYSWSVGGSDSTVVVSSATTQTITVTLTNGACSHDTSFVVYRVLPTPVLTATSDSVCAGGSVTISATGIGDGFSWSNGSSASSITVNPNIQTTYTVSSSLGSCTGTASITIGILKPLTDSLHKSPDSICPGSSVTLTAFPIGTSALSYKWNTGGTTAAISVTPTVTTTYTSTAYGKCDSVVKTITVDVIPFPVPVISGTPYKCRGVKDTLTVSGGTSYLWSNGSTKSSYVTGPIYADSTVSVIAYNALGCSDTATFTINFRAVPNITISHPKAVCSGAPVEIVASAGGTGPFTYSWNTGETTDSISVASPIDSTTVVYTVTVSNGCSTSKTTSITAEYPSLSTCCNQTLIIENDTAVIYAGGNSVSYSWIDSTQVVCLDPPKCDTVRVTPTVTTIYTVVGTDKAGCEVTGYVTILIDVPCLDFNVPNVFTPNFAGPNGHDGEFYIKTDNINSWSIQIFDRWGKEVYKSTDVYSYWTGKNESGSQANDGVYYYVITGVCQSKTYKKSGFVQLIR